jgi:hypothetical protein
MARSFSLKMQVVIDDALQLTCDFCARHAGVRLGRNSPRGTRLTAKQKRMLIGGNNSSEQLTLGRCGSTHVMESQMAIDRLGPAIVVFAMLAVSNAAHASTAPHVSIAHSNIRLDARSHHYDGAPSARMPAPHSKVPVDDPLASLILG